MRTALLLICLTFTTFGAFCGEAPSPKIFGQYFGDKRVCDVSPPHCYKTSDSLSVMENKYAVGNIDVDASFHFDNGHQCTFTGTGFWVKDRILVSSHEFGCELVLFPINNELHTVVTTDEQCRIHCGARGSLDGIVVKKKAKTSVVKP